MQYSEVKELVAYLLRNYRHLLTPEEREVLVWALAERTNNESAELRVVDGPSGVHVDALQICERLMGSKRRVITIERCPRCKRIVGDAHRVECYWCESPLPAR